MMETSLLSAVAALVIASSAQAQNIDTTGNTNQIVYPFGSPDTATYGQTFTAGASDTLNSFSLFLNGTGSSLTFRGYLAEWNGSTEPRRVCRRPQLLRGRGYDEQDDEQVLT
jgi:hypothetical protein